jgi:hypothetical protein
VIEDATDGKVRRIEGVGRRCGALLTTRVGLFVRVPSVSVKFCSLSETGSEGICSSR